MSRDAMRCTTCGATLSLEELRGINCPYCKTAFPHHAQAVQHAALVNQIMKDQFVQANPWMGGMGGMGGAPPQIPQQYGAPPPYTQVPFPAMAVERAVKRSMIGVAVGLGVTLLLVMMGVGFAVFMMFH
jgi:hypothetical protein